jgi:hypothetical protein
MTFGITSFPSFLFAFCFCFPVWGRKDDEHWRFLKEMDLLRGLLVICPFCFFLFFLMLVIAVFASYLSNELMTLSFGISLNRVGIQSDLLEMEAMAA